MKKLIIIPLLLIGLFVSAATYYVAPSTATPAGNDAAAGTITTPWLTWLKAFNTAIAGDTVYFRGGNYPHPSPNSNIGPVNSGTSSDWICFINYPGEVPILDCSNRTKTGYSYAIYVSNKSYLYFKGLHLKDNEQLELDQICGGTNLYNCTNITFENCKSYSHGYTGFADGTCDDLLYINCDSYSNYNFNMSFYSGGGSDGFYSTGGSTGDTIKYVNCRAWFNSDDGWDSMYNNGLVIWEGCWSLGNGYDLGDGTGFKLGHISACDGTLQRLLTRCVSVNNKWSGYNENNNGRPSSRINCYNNVSYRDMYGFMNINSVDDTYNRIYRNNIAYGYTSAATYRFGEPNITHDHNSWNGGVTVTDEDFISVDTTELYGVRQSDGSLPDISFFKLVATSDLINAGVDVGLAFNGTAPDLGYAEYTLEAEPSAPYIATISPYAITIASAKSGGYMISDGGGTISAKGVCWGTVINPDLTDNVISGGTGVADFVVDITGLMPPIIYHVRAYATNETGTTYGADEWFTPSTSSIIKHGGKIVKR